MRYKVLLCAMLAFMLAGCHKDAPNFNIPGEKPTDGAVTSERLTVSSMLQNNMVIQRNKPLQIWGGTKAGSEVTITLSWTALKYTAVAATNGKWSVTIPVGEAKNTPQTISVKTLYSEQVAITNLLIG